MRFDAPVAVANQVLVLGSISVLISTLEWLSIRNALSERGFLSWSVGRLQYKVLSKGIAGSLSSALLSYPNILAVLCIRAVAAIWTILGVLLGLPTSTFPLLLIAATSMLMFLRSPFALDGADQMSLITFLSLSIAFSLGSEVAITIALVFLSLQISLCYLVAGISKVSSRDWRSGRALSQILSTEGYGSVRIGRALAASPTLSLLAGGGIILFQSLFWIALLLPKPAPWIAIGLGTAFHLSIALLMGLNAFFWSFVATYPSVLYVNSLVR